MSSLRCIRVLALALATGTLCCVSFLAWSAAPAGAATRNGVCTLLPGLCPTTTTPTTKAPPTTAAPPPAPTTTRPPATTATTRRSTVGRATSPAPSVGAGVLPTSDTTAPDPTPVTDAVDSAPQLAGTPAPSTTVAAPASPELSGLVGTSTLPSDHSTTRVMLSVVVLLVGVVAAAQLPRSRRSPRPRATPPA